MMNKTAGKLAHFVIATVVALAVGMVLDLICLRCGVPLLTLLVVNNLAIGLVAAAAFLQHSLRKRDRIQALEERLQTISDMNHEIRTCLGIVAFYGTQTSSDYALKVFDEGFQRMEVLVRTVLKKWDLVDSDKDHSNALDAIKSFFRKTFVRARAPYWHKDPFNHSSPQVAETTQGL
jgi:hypothetical protein